MENYAYYTDIYCDGSPLVGYGVQFKQYLDESLSGATIDISKISEEIRQVDDHLTDVIVNVECNLAAVAGQVQTNLAGVMTNVEGNLSGVITNVETNLSGVMTNVECNLSDVVTNVEGNLAGELSKSTDLVNENIKNTKEEIVGKIDTDIKQVNENIENTKAEVIEKVNENIENAKAEVIEKIDSIEIGGGISKEDLDAAVTAINWHGDENKEEIISSVVANKEEIVTSVVANKEEIVTSVVANKEDAVVRITASVQTESDKAKERLEQIRKELIDAINKTGELTELGFTNLNEQVISSKDEIIDEVKKNNGGLPITGGDVE